MKMNFFEWLQKYSLDWETEKIFASNFELFLCFGFLSTAAAVATHLACSVREIQLLGLTLPRNFS